MAIYSGYLERKSRIDETEENMKQAGESISSNDLEINSYLSKIEQYENDLKEINEICDKEKKKPLLTLIKLSNFWYENGQIAKKKKECKRIEGLYQEWYNSGQMKYTRNYKNGQRHGLWEEWYENGQKKYKSNYKNNKYHGFCEEWHENGQKKSEEHKKDGETVNIHKEWEDNGQLSIIRHYTKEGQEHGTFEEWHYNGKKYSFANYINGELHGFWKEWDENGKLEVRYEYSNGERINEKHDIDLEGDKTNQREESNSYKTYDNKTNQRTQSNSYETPKRTYYHSCESGCVVINQDGTSRFKYKKKCNYCGKTSNITSNRTSTSGTMTSSHYCNTCKKKSKVRLKSSRN